MKHVQPSWRWAVLTAFLWFGMNALILHRFPTVYVDEAENANHAYNLAYHHQALFSLYDGLYPPKLAELRYAWPVVIRPFYCYPLALFIQAIGFSLVKARLFSLIAGFLCLLAVYGIGVLLGNVRIGFLAMGILATRFVFLYTSDRIRPESWLGLCGVLAFWGLLAVLESGQWGWAVIPGVLSGVAAGIHTNGAVLILPILILLIQRKNYRALWLAGAGWMIGFSVFLLSADWVHFLPGVRALFFQEFSAPSIVKFHGNLFRAIADETGRYFGGWDFYDWSGGWIYHMVNGWQYALATAAICASGLRRDAWRWPAQFAAWLALGYALFVGQKAFPYISVLEPYFALSLAAWLLSSGRPAVRDVVFYSLLVVAALPFGKVPLLLVGALSVLPKKAFQWGLLLLLVSLLMVASGLRGVFLQLGADFQKWWLFSAVCGFLAFTLSHMRETKKVPFHAQAIAWAILCITTAGTLLFVKGIASYQPSFETLCKDFALQMTPGSRVVAPQSLWLGLSDYDFRDIGGIVWYRLLTGEKDLTRPLKEFHPDYIILNRGLGSQLGHLNALRQAKDLQAPTKLFPWPHRVVSVRDVGPVYGGQLALIQNLWSSEKRQK